MEIAASGQTRKRRREKKALGLLATFRRALLWRKLAVGSAWFLAFAMWSLAALGIGDVVWHVLEKKWSGRIVELVLLGAVEVAAVATVYFFSGRWVLLGRRRYAWLWIVVFDVLICAWVKTMLTAAPEGYVTPVVAFPFVIANAISVLVVTARVEPRK